MAFVSFQLVEQRPEFLPQKIPALGVMLELPLDELPIGSQVSVPLHETREQIVNPSNRKQFSA